MYGSCLPLPGGLRRGRQRTRRGARACWRARADLPIGQEMKKRVGEREREGGHKIFGEVGGASDGLIVGVGLVVAGIVRGVEAITVAGGEFPGDAEELGVARGVDRVKGERAVLQHERREALCSGGRLGSEVAKHGLRAPAADQGYARGVLVGAEEGGSPARSQAPGGDAVRGDAGDRLHALGGLAQCSGHDRRRDGDRVVLVVVVDVQRGVEARSMLEEVGHPAFESSHRADEGVAGGEVGDDFALYADLLGRVRERSRGAARDGPARGVACTVIQEARAKSAHGEHLVAAVKGDISETEGGTTPYV